MSQARHRQRVLNLLRSVGAIPHVSNKGCIQFEWQGSNVIHWTKKQWSTGQSIVDGRGYDHLCAQLIEPEPEIHTPDVMLCSREEMQHPCRCWWEFYDGYRNTHLMVESPSGSIIGIHIMDAEENPVMSLLCRLLDAIEKGGEILGGYDGIIYPMCVKELEVVKALGVPVDRESLP